MNKHSNMQITSLSYFLTRSLFLGMGISSILTLAKEDSWISIILGTFIGFGLISIISFIRNNNSNKNIFEVIKEMDGLKFFFGGLLLIFTLSIIIISLIIFVQLIEMMYLTRSSNILTIGAFMLVIFMCISKSFSTLTRLSFMLGIISITFLVLAFIPLSLKSDFTQFLPILNNSWLNILKAALIYGTLSATPNCFLLINSKDKTINNKKYDMYLNYLITSFFIAIPCIITFAILGKNLATLYAFPEYMILRKISFLRFIENVENFIAFIWIFDIFILISVCFHFINENLKILFTKKHITITKSLIFIITLLMAFYLNKSYDGLLLSYKYFPYLLLIMFLFVFIPIAVFTKKRFQN